jgi:hypothetical protein
VTTEVRAKKFIEDFKNRSSSMRPLAIAGIILIAAGVAIFFWTDAPPVVAFVLGASGVGLLTVVYLG